MDDGRARLAAARWVITLGRLWWALLVLEAAWSLLLLPFAWSPGAAVVPVQLTAAATAWGALVDAYRRHRRGAWRLLVGLAAVQVAVPVLAVAAAGRRRAGCSAVWWPVVCWRCCCTRTAGTGWPPTSRCGPGRPRGAAGAGRAARDPGAPGPQMHHDRHCPCVQLTRGAS